MERIILLCQNQQGYENLCQIISAAHINGFYYQPRVDITLLKERAEGLICISPGYWGPIAQLLQSHFIDQAQEKAMQFSDAFPDRFYLGVQRTGEPGMGPLANDIIEFSNSNELPLVALNDVYFLTADDGWMQEMLHCIQTGREIDIDDQNNSKVSQHFLKSEADMLALFEDVPEAIQNTVKIAEQCQLEMVADQVLLPRFECPDDLSPEVYLEKLVWEALT